MKVPAAVRALVAIVWWVGWAALLVGCRARPPVPASRPCRDVITEPTTRRVFAALAPLRAADGCRLEGIATESSRMEVRWQRDGTPVGAALVRPARCVDPRVADPAALVAAPDAALARACPATTSLLRAALAERPPAIAEAPVASAHLDAAFLVVALALAVVSALGIATGVRSRPRRVAAPLLAFSVALVARLAVAPTLANWYAEVLPAHGFPSEARFGPGAFVYQALLRAVLPWSDGTLAYAHAVIGALAVPVFLAVMREKGVDRRARAVATMLFALAPLHVIISASPSEHVWTSTGTLLSMLAWVRARRRGDVRFVGIALALVPVISLTRPDAWALLGVLPMWGLARDATEKRTRPVVEGPWRRWLVWYAIVWSLTGLAVWEVSRRSHHPLPEWQGVRHAVTALVAQYGDVGFHAPYWMTALPVVLASLGLIAMAFVRPWLLACVIVTLVASFVPLGRDLSHAGPMGARYFLATLPVFFLVSGYGAWAIGVATERIVRGRHAAGLRGVGLGALTLAMLWLSRPAYAHRYAFQDEYTFLRRALARVPDGCRVVQLPVRSTAFDRDLDCCIDLPRSPLPLTFPRLRFGTIERVDLPATTACEVYYESAACSLTSTPEVRARHGRALEWLSTRCAAMHAQPMEPLVEGRTSVPTIDEWFDRRAPHIGLYRRHGADPAAR